MAAVKLALELAGGHISQSLSCKTASRGKTRPALQSSQVSGYDAQ